VEHPTWQSSHSDEGQGDDDPGCGCFDVTVSPNASRVAQLPVKVILSLSHVALPAALIVALPEATAARPLSDARAGPWLIRLLLPSGRQTVLLI
jgi:hypothetical protein